MYLSFTQGDNTPESFIGEEAVRKSGVVHMKHLGRFDPKKGDLGGGIVYDWDVMGKLLDYAAHRLGVNPSEHRYLMSISSSRTDADLNKMKEIVFEKINAPAMYIEEDSVLALFGSQRTTGVVVNAGHEVTHVVPVIDGIPIHKAKRRIRLGGKPLTECMVKMLQERGYGFSSLAEAEMVAEDIKKKLCFVSLDFDKETAKVSSESSSLDKSYTLADGNVVTVQDEIFRCPEILFKPRMFFSHSEVPGLGVSSLLHRAIEACSRNVWSDLYQNVVVTGGSSMFTGFADRLENEISTLAPYEYKSNVHIDAPLDRQYTPWTGGSIVASLPSFHNKWTTKQNYEENGALRT